MFFQVIRFQLKVGNRDAALNAYGAMLDSYGEGETPDPLPAREWMMLCDYLKELKMPAEAAGEYEKLATFYPDQQFTARALICAAELRLQTEDRDRARELFQRAADLAPSAPNWQARIIAGQAQLEKTKTATAN